MDETAADSLYESAVTETRLLHPDNAHIARMLRGAIDAGSPRAAYALATWYLNGKDDDVAQDQTEAVKLLRIAAEVHLPNALYDLAACYVNHGDDDAVFKVGRAYYYGFGVAEDRRVANIWLDRAEELGTFESESRTDADNQDGHANDGGVIDRMKPYSSPRSSAVPRWIYVLGIVVILGFNGFFVIPMLQRVGGQHLSISVGVVLVLIGVIFVIISRVLGPRSNRRI